MSVATINADMAAARTALLAGDYGTAMSYALAAQALLAAMPRISGGGAQGRNELEWDPRGIAGFIASLRKQQAGAGGIQTTKITRHAPECPSDDSCAYSEGAYL
jgi:hypothetical protein